MKCPCKDCVPPQRSATCHSICEEYKEWSEKHNKEKEREYDYKESISGIVGYYSRRKRKRR